MSKELAQGRTRWRSAGLFMAPRVSSWAYRGEGFSADRHLCVLEAVDKCKEFPEKNTLPARVLLGDQKLVAADAEGKCV